MLADSRQLSGRQEEAALPRSRPASITHLGRKPSPRVALLAHSISLIRSGNNKFISASETSPIERLLLVRTSSFAGPLFRQVHNRRLHTLPSRWRRSLFRHSSFTSLPRVCHSGWSARDGTGAGACETGDRGGGCVPAMQLKPDGNKWRARRLNMDSCRLADSHRGVVAIG